MWHSKLPLATKFQEMFRCAANCRAYVSDYMDRAGDCVVQGPILQRNLMELEEGQFQEMLSLLNDVYISMYGIDRMVWKGAIHVEFSVTSLLWLHAFISFG